LDVYGDKAMKGKLYGIGVGPGDPGLLTLRAKEAIEAADAVVYPVTEPGEESAALGIVEQVADLSGKELVEALFRMEMSVAIRSGHRAEAVDTVVRLLSEGKDVAMITLGDVSIYSTYMRINDAVEAEGYETEVIPGIPSFCGAAALAKIPLVMGRESLAVVSAARDMADARTAIRDFDNVVVMKAGKRIGEIREAMEANGIPVTGATVMHNVGMGDEYVGPLRDGDYGYFTTVVIKKDTGGKRE